MMETTLVSLKRATKSLVMGGRMKRMACGRMLRRKVVLRREAERDGRLPLAVGHREQARAVALRLVGGAVEAEAEHRRLQGREAQGDRQLELQRALRERVVQEEEQEQDRQAAEELDGQQHREQGDEHRKPGALEEQGEVAGEGPLGGQGRGARGGVGGSGRSVWAIRP